MDCQDGDARLVQGWLNLWTPTTDNLDELWSDGKIPTPIWEPHFCVLDQKDQKICHYRTEQLAAEQNTSRELDESHDVSADDALRLDGGKKAFEQRWGYEGLESIKENTPAPLEVFNRCHTLDGRKSKRDDSESAYDRDFEERRGSGPVVSPSNSEENVAAPSASSRLASLFSKKVKTNLKRTKSVTKLDRKKAGISSIPEVDGEAGSGGGLKRTMSLGRLSRKWGSGRVKVNSRNLGDLMADARRQRERVEQERTRSIQLNRALLSARMRSSRSHESLLITPSDMHAVDLQGEQVEIRPLHSSILGQDHCFQIRASNGSTRYYSCRTQEERNNLRKAALTNEQMVRRTDNSLKLWVLEAKNVAAKKKYFCEVLLDKTLYARTSTKCKSEMLFWGEQFDFGNLPKVDVVTVNLYKEPDKKKKRDKNLLLGYIHIPVDTLTNRQLVERWYTVSSAVVGKSGKDNKNDLPVLRVKARYQSVHVLAGHCYNELLGFIDRNYLTVLGALEPVISVRAKDEIGTSLSTIMQHQGKAPQFLADLVMADLQKLENENLTFRGNSIATKAVEAYMKLVGEKYLHDVLGDFVRTVMEAQDDCEVDPARVPNANVLSRNRQHLIMYSQMAWFKIINSHLFFPNELRALFSLVCESCQRLEKRTDVARTVISGSIFLRLLCPAILSPSLFRLCTEFPQDKCQRNFTLIAKTIQSLANFTKFGAKEDFMTFMNDFVEGEFASTNSFIQQISTRAENNPSNEFDGYIDLSKELSLLHSLLSENIKKDACTDLTTLEAILDSISRVVADPSATYRPLQRTSELYDNETRLSSQSPDISDTPDTPESATETMETTGTMDSTRTSSTLDSTRTASTDDTAGTPATSSKHAFSSHNSSQLLDSSLSAAPDDYVVFSDVTTSPLGPTRLQAQSTPTRRPSERQLQDSWKKIVTAADMVNGDYVDLINFMDDGDVTSSSPIEARTGSSSVELDNSSVGHISTVGSSGYQSFGGYSQSNSPVIENQPLAFANPLALAKYGYSRREQRVHSVPSSSSKNSGDTSSDDESRASAHVRNSTTAPAAQAPVVRHVTISGSSSSSESLPRHTLLRGPSLSSPVGGKVTHQGHAGMGSWSVNGLNVMEPTGSALTASELSQSADFAHQRRRQLRRDHDAMTSSAAAEPDYEAELARLRLQLAETQAQLEETQNRLLTQHEGDESGCPGNSVSSGRAEQRSSHTQPLGAVNQQVVCHQAAHLEGVTSSALADRAPSIRRQASRQSSVEESTAALPQVEGAEMQEVIQRLKTAEQELQRERLDLRSEASHREQVIADQERRIHSLDAANSRLIQALHQLKDRVDVQNGVRRSGPPPPVSSSTSQNLLERGPYKSSCC